MSQDDNSEVRYRTFLSDLNSDMQAVLSRMDQFEDDQGMRNKEADTQVIRVLLKWFERIDNVAQELVGEDGSDEDRDKHLECLLLLLSWARNQDSYWFFLELPKQNSSLYALVRARLLDSKPLTSHAKKLRERICFHEKRRIAVMAVTNKEAYANTIAALEALIYV